MSSEDTLREYQTLLERKELALMNLEGVVIHAIGNLNLNDPPEALRTLMYGLDLFRRAEQDIEAFRRKHIPQQSQPESPIAAKEAA